MDKNLLQAAQGATNHLLNRFGNVSVWFEDGPFSGGVLFTFRSIVENDVNLELKVILVHDVLLDNVASNILLSMVKDGLEDFMEEQTDAMEEYKKWYETQYLNK